ncbi:MAG: hypothetical protein AAB329_03060, partial [Pseudomonadota bacterium]
FQNPTPIPGINVANLLKTAYQLKKVSKTQKSQDSKLQPFNESQGKGGKGTAWEHAAIVPQSPRRGKKRTGQRISSSTAVSSQWLNL